MESPGGPCRDWREAYREDKMISENLTKFGPKLRLFDRRALAVLQAPHCFISAFAVDAVWDLRMA
jgi:hypothetical protein